MTFGDPVFKERLNILKQLNMFKRKDTIFKNRDDDIFKDRERLMRILNQPNFPRSIIVDLEDLDDPSIEKNDSRNNCPCSVYLRCQLIYTFIFGLMTLLLYTRDVQKQKQNNEGSYSWLFMVALWIFGTICLFVSEHGKNTATHIRRMLEMVRNCLRWIYLCRCSEYLKFQLLCTFIFGTLTLLIYIHEKQKEQNNEGCYLWLFSFTLWIFGTIGLYVLEYRKNVPKHFRRVLWMVRHCLGRIYLFRCNDYLKCQFIYAFIWGPLTLILYMNHENLKELNVDSSYIWPLSLAAWIILELSLYIREHGQ
ncbi:hypothetical protein CDAR_19271 [Caerostris darwini]|uniref:Gustatory receptor n=1 Tax=Caerostris darwini TaxID=1538125 RepID=A0AAV4WBY0_9ARAC|nr:hypothetical protein CDAR_19271 [Caerostris darwini]